MSGEGGLFFDRLGDILMAALKKLELYYGLKADESLLKRALWEAVHIFIHEASHVFTRAAIRWLNELTDVERELLEVPPNLYRLGG